MIHTVEQWWFIYLSLKIEMDTHQMGSVFSEEH